MYLYILFGPAGLWPHNFGLCAVGLTKDSVMSVQIAHFTQVPVIPSNRFMCKIIH